MLFRTLHPQGKLGRVGMRMSIVLKRGMVHVAFETYKDDADNVFYNEAIN